ncbi:MAG: FtsX-like permease family protein [Planctomycetes bacterium]|nr:FtsX-like permease family protein [Planctomycetota bacterium]MCL4730924.1 FtsX-like permease family protein [Planctomycetota bacterium]
MRALNRKLLRDLWHMKGQALAICLVIMSGVALFVAQLATLDRLKVTQQEYYAQYRFADVFAACKRAPESVAGQIAAIEGVDAVQTRIVVDVTLDIPGLDEPAIGRLVSLPDHGRPVLNDVHLRAGRWPAADDEVLANEAFAAARGYREGSTISALLNGRKRVLTITGVGLSPEFIYSIRGGANPLPDDKRFGVLWMPRRGLESAFDMEGAFNNVALKLGRGASGQEVARRLDMILERHGGFGATLRANQLSHWFLNNELEQLSRFGVVVPLVFLGVAAFLLNVVLNRLISTQREQIAALKAFGYGNPAIGLHYAKLILLFVVIGTALGAAVGAYLGDALVALYGTVYRFPSLTFALNPLLPLAAGALSGAACYAGTLKAVLAAASLPPAEAMRPQAPPLYRPTVIERLGLQRLLSQPARMILRNLERRPYRALLSISAIGMAVAILVWGFAFIDSIWYVIDSQEYDIQREDITVAFVEPRPQSALHAVRAQQGVLHAEPFRSVAARVRFEHRHRLTGLTGVPRGVTLSRVVDENLRPVAMPADGLVLSRWLGRALGVKAGDSVQVEVLEARRPALSVPVAALVDDFVGLNAYMDLDALGRLMGEDGVISGAHLRVDPARQTQLYRALKDMPAVAGVAVKASTIQSMRDQITQNLMYSVIFNIVFACIIAFGVVYNNARIALGESARELASLRVLGLTRAEISFILLGELAVLTVVALPVGCVMGWAISVATGELLNTEVIRLPLKISDFSYAFGCAVVLAASTVSALVVRRRLDHLDLVEVLKSRE